MIVSIIVPIFNAETYILSCLSSIQRQSYCDLEVILVDDCSTDGSIMKVKEFLNAKENLKEQHIKWKLLSQKVNQGQSAARNRGILESHGDYVFFLDSDDVLETDSIEKLVCPLEDNPGIQIVMGNYRCVGNTEFAPLLLGEGLYENRHIEYFCSKQYYVMPWNKLIKRQFIIDNELFFENGIIHEDNLWSFKVACKIEKMYVVADVTYNYIVHTGSSQQDENFLWHQKCYQKAVEKMIDFAFENKIHLNQYIYKFLDDAKHGHCLMPLWKGKQELSKEFYSMLRHSSHCTLIELVRLGVSFGQFLMELHYYLPKSLGYKWFVRANMNLHYKKNV